MTNVMQFMTFLFLLLVPVIAIYAELSRHTPNSIWYSSIRSVLCIASLIACAFVISPIYKANILHFMCALIFFSVSFIQLLLETNDMSYSDILHNLKDEESF